MQERFLKAAQDLEELLDKHQKREAIEIPLVHLDEEQGVSLTLKGATVTYSLPSAQEDIVDYLEQEWEHHSRFLNAIERLNSLEYRNLSKLQSRIHRFLLRKTQNKQEIKYRMTNQEINIAVEKVIIEGALMAYYFFQEVVKEEGIFASYLRPALEEYNSSGRAQENHAGLLLLTENMQKQGTNLLGNSLEILGKLEDLHHSYLS